MSDIFGCDIGNGFCYISILKNENNDPIDMLPAKLANEGMPSVAYVKDSTHIEVYDDKSAIEKYRARRPENLVYAIKTRLKERTISVGDVSAETDAIYAAIARDLVIQGNKRRRELGMEPVYELVFTFPNLFVNDLSLLNRMQKSIESVSVDGHRLKVIARLPEAAAVAIDYLHYMRYIISEPNRIKSKSLTVLVYDLGHGTFDTSVVRADGDKVPQLMIKDYAEPIGGKDFDKVIENEILGQLNKNYNYIPKGPRQKERVRVAAVNIKHNLSEYTEWEETIEVDGEYYAVSLTRDRFEELSDDLLMRTISKTFDALEEAKSRNIKIDAVVLSGGGSLMPMVHKALDETLLGEGIPIRLYRPSTAVSYGAARYAYGEMKRQEDIEEEEEKRRKEEEKRRKEEEKRRKEEEKRRKEEEKRKTKDKTSIDVKREKRVSEDKSNQHRNTIPANYDESGAGVNLKETLKPSLVLQQMADYSYGFLLGNQVFMVIKGNDTLPASSTSPVKMRVENGEVELRVYRSKKKMNLEILDNPEEDGYSIQRFTFYFPQKQCTFEASMIVQEDYNVIVVCKLEDGTTLIKSTLDSTDVLYGRRDD